MLPSVPASHFDIVFMLIAKHLRKLLRSSQRFRRCYRKEP